MTSSMTMRSLPVWRLRPSERQTVAGVSKIEPTRQRLFEPPRVGKKTGMRERMPLDVTPEAVPAVENCRDCFWKATLRKCV